MNLIDEIWKRNTFKKNNFYSLPNKDVGSNYINKINRVVSNLKSKGADIQFISSSENNAWLLNIRGNDAKYTPIPHSYILIDRYKNIKLFCDLKKIPLSLKRYFKN